jgi:hypothetical protein
MRWDRQVIHVAWKDVRLMRWLLLAYAAAVAAAVLATSTPRLMSGPAMLASLLVVLFGVLLVAVLIQADSPARSDAFWVSHPLHPGAVFGAKVLVVALALLAPALVGQLLALVAHDLPAAALPGLLGESALQYGRWLAMAGLVAVVSRDLRTFLLAMVVVTIGVGMATLTVVHLLAPGRALPPGAGVMTPFLWLAAGLVVAGYQYRTRNLRRGLVLVGLAVVLITTLGAVGPYREAGRAARGVVPAELRGAELRLNGMALIQWQRAGATGNVPLHVRLEGVSDRHRYYLVAPTVWVDMPDGTSERVPESTSFVDFGVPGSPFATPIDAPVRWALPPQRPEDWQGIWVELTRSQREAIVSGNAGLRLEGDLEILEARRMGALPLRPGAAAAGGGQRIGIVGVTPGNDGPTVDVHMTEVSSSRLPTGLGHPGLPSRWTAKTYALINPDRGEGVQMSEGGGSGTGSGLVIPGPAVSSWSREVGPMRMPPRQEREWRADADWLAGAELHVVQWVPLGSYPVEVGTRFRLDLVPVTPAPSPGTAAP